MRASTACLPLAQESASITRVCPPCEGVLAMRGAPSAYRKRPRSAMSQHHNSSETRSAKARQKNSAAAISCVRRCLGTGVGGWVRCTRPWTPVLGWTVAVEVLPLVQQPVTGIGIHRATARRTHLRRPGLSPACGMLHHSRSPPATRRHNPDPISGQSRH